MPASWRFLYVLFTKFFPIVSIWEVHEGRECALPETADRIRSYMPGAITAGQEGAD